MAGKITASGTVNGRQALRSEVLSNKRVADEKTDAIVRLRAQGQAVAQQDLLTDLYAEALQNYSAGDGGSGDGSGAGASGDSGGAASGDASGAGTSGDPGGEGSTGDGGSGDGGSGDGGTGDGGPGGPGGDGGNY